jgi:Skp family chaperone for outer membrane proteins
MFVKRISCAALAGGLIVVGAVVAAQQSGRPPDPLPATARPGDADEDPAAVAREIAQLEVDLLDAEVKLVRAQVDEALKARVQYETSTSTADPKAWEEAEAAYRKARAVLLEKTRTLAIARRRVGKAEEAKAEPKAPKAAATGAAVGSIDINAVLERYAGTRRPARTSTPPRPGAGLKQDAPGDRALMARAAHLEVDRPAVQPSAALLKEIDAAIAAVVAAKGLDFVVRIDAPPGPEPSRMVVYANPRNDITAEVLRELNRRAANRRESTTETQRYREEPSR